MCILVAVASTTNLLVIPLIFLIIRDPKSTEGYGVELGDRTFSIDTDMAGRYEKRIKNLQKENQILTDKLAEHKHVTKTTSQIGLIDSDTSPLDPADYLVDIPAQVKRESLL